VDSILLKSMISGDWCIIENPNLASAAVLDRLNGLLED
jgi:midasin (ATPase involved in ribosome maturation)